MLNRVLLGNISNETVKGLESCVAKVFTPHKFVHVAWYVAV